MIQSSAVLPEPIRKLHVHVSFSFPDNAHLFSTVIAILYLHIASVFVEKKKKKWSNLHEVSRSGMIVFAFLFKQ